MKWRHFGYLLTEAYSQLKRENARLRQERLVETRISAALKEQVQKLKALLRIHNSHDCQ